MNQTMQNRYRVFRPVWGTFYREDLVTKKQATLKTRDKDEACRIVAAKNETEEAPAFTASGAGLLEGRRPDRRQTNVAEHYGRDPQT